MKRTILAAVLLAGAAMISPASATTIEDPLHGTCLVGCSTNLGPPPNVTILNPIDFGFQASPAETVPGTLTMEFLVPISEPIIIGGINVTASTAVLTPASPFTALFAGTWTTGTLSEFLNIDAFPTNPLSAFAGSGCDVNGNNCSGFNVYEGIAGDYTIPQQGTLLTLGTTPLWSVLGGLPQGTSIVAFFDDPGERLVATVNSGALNVAVPGPIVGAGIPGLVAALGGMFGLNFYRRRRNNSHLPA